MLARRATQIPRGLIPTSIQSPLTPFLAALPRPPPPLSNSGTTLPAMPLHSSLLCALCVEKTRSTASSLSAFFLLLHGPRYTAHGTRPTPPQVRGLLPLSPAASHQSPVTTPFGYTLGFARSAPLRGCSLFEKWHGPKRRNKNEPLPTAAAGSAPHAPCANWKR